MKKPKVGRAVIKRKLTVSEVFMLDMRTFTKSKILHAGPGNVYAYICFLGNHAAEVIAVMVKYEGDEPCALRLLYNVRNPFIGNDEDVYEEIQLSSTTSHSGGERWWFVCPNMHDGQWCGKRCRSLYLPIGSKHFACRKCHNLSYESRQKHRLKYYENCEKPFKKIALIENRLKHTNSPDELRELNREWDEAFKKIHNYIHQTNERSDLQ
ncbi:MAG TPA: hypothetical protein PKW76_15450 [bacterium]|nr:hypothetical protein [bacterium]HPG47071.1 hypothetical protein [bacterium]HPM99341.1 hypothetical protein [bacterium]